MYDDDMICYPDMYISVAKSYRNIVIHKIMFVKTYL